MIKKDNCIICGKKLDKNFNNKNRLNTYCSLECEYANPKKVTRKYSYELKNNILEYSIFKKNKSIRSIANTFGVSNNMVETIIREYGNRENKKLLKFNTRFFKTINTEEKAYWLGFIYADGYIGFNKKGGSFELTLKYSDIKHLEKLNTTLNSEVEIKTKYVKLNDKIFKACRLGLHRYEFCKDLKDKGCVERKSLILKFPQKGVLTEDLVKHFIRGYFDGDGHVHSYGINNDCYVFQLLGTFEMLNTIKKYFIKNNLIYDIPKYPKRTKKDSNKNTFFMNFSGNNARNILYHCYKNSNIYLDRKYKVIKPLLARYSPIL